MATAIRLRREGNKNRAFYRVVVADKRSPRDGKFIEILGTYNPHAEENQAELKLDRINYWLGVGAQPSDTVRSLVKKAKATVAKA